MPFEQILLLIAFSLLPLFHLLLQRIRRGLESEAPEKEPAADVLRRPEPPSRLRLPFENAGSASARSSDLRATCGARSSS